MIILSDFILINNFLRTILPLSFLAKTFFFLMDLRIESLDGLVFPLYIISLSKYIIKSCKGLIVNEEILYRNY